MASVRQLPAISKKTGKRPWVCDYTDASGKRRRLTPKSGLKRDAETMRQKVEAELSHGLHLPASQSITVAEAIDQWLANCEKRVSVKDRLRPLTLKNWRNLTNKNIRPALGKMLLVDLTTIKIQAWIDGLAYAKPKPLGRPSLVHCMNCLSFILKFMHGKGLVAQNVLLNKGVRIPGRKSDPIAVPEKHHVKALLQKSEIMAQGGAAPYLRPMLYIAIYSGLRLGEIRALSWSNVDLAEGTIKVRVGMDPFGNIDQPKSSAGVRDVPIPPALSVELKRWHLSRGRPQEGLVFTGQGGVWIKESALSISWRRLQHRAFGGQVMPCGVPKSHYNFHALRHVYASLLIESGLPPKRVQYLMGHSSITMTFDRYGYLFEDAETVRDAISRVGASLAVR